MATTKERDELHRTIWAIANELRGKVDGWDFKAYILGTLFRMVAGDSCIVSGTTDRGAWQLVMRLAR